MESITFVTVLGPGTVCDAPVGCWASIPLTPGGGVGERLADGVVVELETGALQRGRDGPLTDQQTLVGEFAERGPHRESGQHQRRWAVDRAAERSGEFGVGDGRRP